MKGPEVRQLLHRDRLDVIKQASGFKVVDEVGIPWGVVADVMACGAELHGYEIKGETDTLKRLPSQAVAYGNVFQRCFVVAAERHLAGAEAMLPDWWGLWLAQDDVLTEVRPAQANPTWKALDVLHMLWRPELEALLREGTPPKGLARWPAGKMAEVLARRLDREAVPALVSRAIMQRTTWGLNRVNPA